MNHLWLSTIALLTAIFLVELSSYGIDYHKLIRTSPDNLWEHPFWRPEPGVLFRLKANLEFRDTVVGGDLFAARIISDPDTYHLDVSLDSQGFRNPKDRSNIEIALIGDSMIQAMYLKENKIVSSLLEERTHFRVGNFGVSHYGPLHQFAALKKYVLPKKPKSIIWFFFEGNDLNDIHQYIEDKEKLQQALKQPAMRKSFFSLLAKKLTMRKKPLNPGEKKRFKLLNGNTTNVYFGYRPKKLTERDQQALSTLRRSLEKAYQLCRKSDIKFSFVFLPTKFRAFYPHSKHSISSRIQKIVQEISPSIRYLDFTNAFSKALRDGELVYLRDDTHLSEIGHSILSDHLVEVISQSELELSFHSRDPTYASPKH